MKNKIIMGIMLLVFCLLIIFRPDELREHDFLIGYFSYMCVSSIIRNLLK